MDRFQSGVCGEFAQDVLDMIVDGGAAYAKLLGYDRCRYALR